MPVWNLTVKLSPLWHDESVTFPSRRDGIVKIIGESGWRGMTNDVDEFNSLLEELSVAYSPKQFDHVFRYLYDLADSDRVWIETF